MWQGLLSALRWLHHLLYCTYIRIYEQYSGICADSLLSWPRSDWRSRAGWPAGFPDGGRRRPQLQQIRYLVAAVLLDQNSQGCEKYQVSWILYRIRIQNVRKAEFGRDDFGSIPLSDGTTCSPSLALRNACWYSATRSRSRDERDGQALRQCWGSAPRNRLP